jgi:glyoxylate reductase
VLTDTTADLTWALLLATARRVTEGDALVRQGVWRGWEPTQMLGVEVHGKTLGIVGLGRIGQAVARRATGFEMRVLYCRKPDHHEAKRDEEVTSTWREVPLDELLRQSDFVSLHVPLTAHTHHLIGPAQLEHLQPTAILINTSRGPVVDEAALAQALRSGRLGGAGLDVYEREPEIYPGLRNLRQVVLLPHLGSATLSTRIRMGMTCLDNLLAVLEGRPAPNRVLVEG